MPEAKYVHSLCHNPNWKLGFTTTRHTLNISTISAVTDLILTELKEQFSWSTTKLKKQNNNKMDNSSDNKNNENNNINHNNDNVISNPTPWLTFIF